MAVNNNQLYALNGEQIQDLSRRLGGIKTTAESIGNNLSNFENSTLNAFNNKVDKVNGKGLSTEDFTTNLKNKLELIENNAQENDIETISINGVDVPIDNKNIDIFIPTLVNNLNSNLANASLTAAQGNVLNNGLLNISNNVLNLGNNVSDLNNSVFNLNNNFSNLENDLSNVNNSVIELNNALVENISNLENLVNNISNNIGSATVYEVEVKSSGSTYYLNIENSGFDASNFRNLYNDLEAGKTGTVVFHVNKGIYDSPIANFPSLLFPISISSSQAQYTNTIQLFGVKNSKITVPKIGLVDSNNFVYLLDSYNSNQFDLSRMIANGNETNFANWSAYDYGYVPAALLKKILLNFQNSDLNITNNVTNIENDIANITNSLSDINNSINNAGHNYTAGNFIDINNYVISANLDVVAANDWNNLF